MARGEFTEESDIDVLIVLGNITDYEGEGPKAGRYVFEKDRAITFRQLISNTSGYMKPGEEPGKVFHYQTFGMNILTHAIAKSMAFTTSMTLKPPRGLNR